MGTETTSATYRRTQTHESQSFSTELLESKGTGSKHLPQAHHSNISPSMLWFIYLRGLAHNSDYHLIHCNNHTEVMMNGLD